MEKFSLLPDEALILKTDRVRHNGGAFATYTNELILTSQNLVVVVKGTFGNTKDIIRFPLNQIKMFNGEPQALLGKAKNGYPQMEIYFINGQQETFGFESMGKKEIFQWINAICRTITGHDSSTTNKPHKSSFSIPGAGIFADALSDTVDSFKGVLGIKSTQSTSKEPAVRISKKCISCSAPLIGEKGQTVKCKYCDTNQVL